MRKNNYNWTYRENDCQNYYDIELGKDYLCVYAHKKYPDVWMAMYTKNGHDVTLLDKTFNDRQRKKDIKNGIGCAGMPKTVRFLCNKDPEYMMKKIIYAYEHDLQEISR